MKIRFLGQGYNTQQTDSMAQILINALKDPAYYKFACLVAFASRSGVSGLAPHIHKSKGHIKEYKLVVGIDQKATSLEALEELLALEVDTYIYYTTQRIIFHPKIYLFEGDERNLVIIGSNNLTQTGLIHNIEASTIIEFDKGDTQGIEFVQTMKQYFSSLFDGSDANLKRLTQELLDKLKRSFKIPSESNRSEVYEKEKEGEGEIDNSDVEGSEDVLNEIFSSIPVQKAPSDFKPVRSKKDKSSNPESGPTNTRTGGSPELFPTDETEDIAGEESAELNNNAGSPGILWPVHVIPNWSISADSEVLIAEISGPGRWEQANFDLNNFTNFFGATVGTSDYFIDLIYIHQDGSLDGIQSSQAVTVASSNYRFELSAAAGKPYPSNGKPIGIFVKVALRQFVYTLYMPQDSGYSAIMAVLASRFAGGSSRNKRIRLSASELSVALPQLQLWSL
ncbi:phospholipase D family protein [Terrimonas sp. NA20]|uniref:Phospholipase D family protein n=1 Tax=Terrimonas ginsenosidimutans TaxID=2908004 RepID=A0ABS9KKF4_9BACT|nr:phospholipase D family protein [Terrimonas ginsenosidimutans]MCG2612798.1 phospholipase D family protein [Terrimonas ginsenosidimutans]